MGPFLGKGSRQKETLFRISISVPGGAQPRAPNACSNFPEHTAAPACRAGMLYSQCPGAAHENSQLLPKGIFSCIIYLNTCLRLQGRVWSLSEGGREERHRALDRFHWKIREQRQGTTLGYGNEGDGTSRIVAAA